MFLLMTISSCQKDLDTSIPAQEPLAEAMGMGFGIFFRDTQVKNMRVENKTFFRDLKVFDLVVLFGIKDVFTVSGEVAAQVDVVAVAPQAVAVIGYNLDRSFFNLFEYPGIREDHEIFLLGDDLIMARQNNREI